MRTFRAVSEIGGSIFCESLHFQRTTMRQGKSATMSAESKSKEDSLTQSNDSGGAVPSGFILKLFQMVNGAPDEVITWTPSGDAFIIGSDLNRLESETLPQYFRHNRFQSLVRQLNFYSFRKINRERNVWIYKHKLFHRDSPEDLHLVRRRTCPGVDGRKQRFSRYSAQKLSKYGNEKDNQSSDDTSLGDSSDDESEGNNRKRSMVDSRNSTSKRSRRSLWYGSSKSDGEKKVLVDTSVISKQKSPTSVFDANNTSLFKQDIDEDDSSANKKSNRMEAIEQAMIVSEVATKLEEHARKAMKGRGSSRSGRGNAGVVTPPFGSHQKFTMSTRDLITYDDEYERQEDACLVSDADDRSVESSDESVESLEKSQSVAEDLLVAPVKEEESVKRISEEIRQRAKYNTYHSEMIHASASVAEFFMSTPPSEDAQVVVEKVLGLLSSSGRLASDFHFYRAALHPENAGSDMIPSFHQRFEQHHADALRRSLEGGASKLDALREFKIFCVNLIYRLLGKNGSFDIQEPFGATDCANLLRTAEAWSKSVGTSA